ncbi:hypothetical protein K440DRAFT_638867 [Wilcoxina mikolae CBS 423.85]|nr:hypothetical protein K440DRAFT_638867 [Wilcoxina mikolae CBS 423.85]
MKFSTALLSSIGVGGAVANILIRDIDVYSNSLTKRDHAKEDGRACRIFAQEAAPDISDLSLYNDKSLESEITTFNTTKRWTKVTKYMNDADSTFILPIILGGAAWYDGEGKVIRYGGHHLDPILWNQFNLTITKNDFWSLDTKSLEWEKVTPKGADGLLRASAGAYANVPELGLGFYVGGLVTNRTDSTFNDWGLPGNHSLALNSMLIYDLRNNEIRNITNLDFKPLWSAVLQYVPIGKKGQLILIGGFESDEAVSGPDPYSPRPMNVVHVYDIDSEKWYKQAAGGFIPEDRGIFCSSIASAPDNSSHSIFIHGGASRSNVFSDTYVLSVPSFEWVQVDDGFNTEPRYRHTCHMTKQNKMLVIGGAGAGQSIPTITSWNTYKNGRCDKYAFMNVLDVNTLKWQDNFEPITEKATKYEVNSAITEVIGGDKNGGAKLGKPEGGWDQDDLGAIYEEYWKKPSSTNSSANPTQSASGVSASASAKSAACKAAPKAGLLGIIVLVTLALSY